MGSSGTTGYLLKYFKSVLVQKESDDVTLRVRDEVISLIIKYEFEEFISNEKQISELMFILNFQKILTKSTRSTFSFLLVFWFIGQILPSMFNKINILIYKIN